MTDAAIDGVETDILRLDELHPVVSGNKWFKLQYYLRDALAREKHTIATFGGAYSNHIVATAYAAREAGLKSIGYIRGEASAYQPSIEEAAGYGMEFRFVTRDQYKQKRLLIEQEHQTGWHWIMEGGYGPVGAKGAAGILQPGTTDNYTHIVCAVGTGTMMAGLIKAAGPAQEVVGIAVLKHPSLEKEVSRLLTKAEQGKPCSLHHDYHFGGYAKHPPGLISFMNELWEKHAIPTDIVYTSRVFFGLRDLIGRKYFPPGSRILLVHSGGLQGNRSLTPGTLLFRP